MLDDFRRRILGAVGRMRELGQKIGRKPMATQIASLCDLLERIVANCERDPEDIRAARSLPFYVEKVEEYVKCYVTLAKAGENDPDIIKRLESTEAMIVCATGRFEEIHKAMRENDLRSREA